MLTYDLLFWFTGLTMSNLNCVLLCSFLGLFSLSVSAQQSTDWMPAHSFTSGVEGPAVDRQGNLYAVNFAKQGTIGIISGQDKGEIFLTLPGNSIGNGIRFDQEHNMYIADYVNHQVFKYHLKSKKLIVYAQNNAMNQPNDLAIMENGILFASDPKWSTGTGNIWRINLDGSTSLLANDMDTTNGIEVSPDNQYLYVNESVQRNVWRFRLTANGGISNKTLFYHFNDHGMDGMRTDKYGNLYIARYGAGEIAVLSPQGKLLKTLSLKGRFPTNVAFGGIEGKQLFVTMQKRGTIETLYLDTAGRNF